MVFVNLLSTLILVRHASRHKDYSQALALSTPSIHTLFLCVSALHKCSQNMGHSLIFCHYVIVFPPVSQPCHGQVPFLRPSFTGSLRRHLSWCGVKYFASKRSPPPHWGRSTLSAGVIHLQISTTHMPSQFADDTHFATHTLPSNLLNSKSSLWESAQLPLSLPVPPITKPQTKSTLQKDHSDTGTEFEVNDSPRSLPDSPAFPDSPAQVNEPDADFAFMQQFAPFIDPDTENPFAPSNFCDEYVHNLCASPIKVHWYLSANFPHHTNWSVSNSPAFRMQSCHAWPNSKLGCSLLRAWTRRQSLDQQSYAEPLPPH